MLLPLRFGPDMPGVWPIPPLFGRVMPGPDEVPPPARERVMPGLSLPLPPVRQLEIKVTDKLTSSRSNNCFILQI
jgi:hypothetical protein